MGTSTLPCLVTADVLEQTAGPRPLDYLVALGDHGLAVLICPCQRLSLLEPCRCYRQVKSGTEKISFKGVPCVILTRQRLDETHYDAPCQDTANNTKDTRRTSESRFADLVSHSQVFTESAV